MAEQPNELQKLAAIATDMELNGELRAKAQETIAKMNTHEALLALLEIAANERLNRGERELALKYGTQIIKAGK